jgi:hypothetical protein
MFNLTTEQTHAVAVRAGGAVRAFATLAVAYAVQKHWIPGSGLLSGWLGDQLAAELAMAVTAGGMFAWSWINKNKDRNRLLAAIAADPTAATTLDTFLSDFKASTKTQARVTGGTGPMQLVLVLVLLGAMTSCVRVHLPRLPDGSLDVRRLVTWASDGVEADCQFQPTAAFCIFGRDAVADARAAMDRNPAALQVAARRSLVDSAAKWPVIQPWVQWLVDGLTTS